jgi:hypothetical protein
VQKVANDASPCASLVVAWFDWFDLDFMLNKKILL